MTDYTVVVMAYNDNWFISPITIAVVFFNKSIMVHKSAPIYRPGPVFTKLFRIRIKIRPRIHKAFHIQDQDQAPCSQSFSYSGSRSGPIFTKLFRIRIKIRPRIHKAFQNQDQDQAPCSQSFSESGSRPCSS